ncbi:MAG: RodZ domain-containing protein [Pseudomonadota bacterium]
MSETEEPQQEELDTASPEQTQPGERLRRAREAAALSVAEVAKRMRISERMVTALEEDDYDSFPSAAFVSGYLRSYARLLDLPEEEFVRPVKESVAPPSLVSTIGEREQVSSRALPVRLVTYLLLGAVLVSIVMWWLAQGERNESVETLPSAGQVVDPGSDIGLSLPQDSSGGQTAVEPVPEEGADARPEAPTPTADEAGEPADTEQQDSPTEQAEAPVEEEPTQQAEPEQSQAEQAQPAPLTEDTPKSALRLVFSEDSWTEINDDAGRRLAYGLIRAGQTLELTGQAPFQVFLGYAPGVDVYYNGERFDHAPFQRQDVARFRVGRAEHNLPGPR